MADADPPLLPEEFADPADMAALEEIAARTGRSPAEMIREAIHKAVLANRVWDESFFTVRSEGSHRAGARVGPARDLEVAASLSSESQRELGVEQRAQLLEKLREHLAPVTSPAEQGVLDLLSGRHAGDPDAWQRVSFRLASLDLGPQVDLTRLLLRATHVRMAATEQTLLVQLDRRELGEGDAEVLDALVEEGVVAELESGSA
ncbi:ribbon-helix-helix protein, CopG family [Streptomyces sp. NPDC050848]|uniref:ribbon-helix-helix protein, CopG family n=1 Tax=Streptomyces sp. NPDC050848 TaxID=3155791 RepID=UPI0033D4489A